MVSNTSNIMCRLVPLAKPNNWAFETSAEMLKAHYPELSLLLKDFDSPNQIMK